MFKTFLLGPAEHLSVIVYLIIVIKVIAIIVVAVGAGAVVVAIAEQVAGAVGANVVAKLVEDCIEALPFPLLKGPTLGD